MESILDIGARDGHFSRMFTNHFSRVTALDLDKPAFNIPGVECVEGDATNLQFATGAFDVVFAAEVIEHIPNVRAACREMARVAKHQVIIGVPYKQDTRCGRTTCAACGAHNPPWGHVNTFDEARMADLFPGMKASYTYVWQNSEATNPLSAWLMDLAGNPHGTYDQDEPCGKCGAKIQPPKRATWQRGLSAAATVLNRIQRPLNPTHANWIHAVFTHGTP
jgi:SAM-dependent methyltransferase